MDFVVLYLGHPSTIAGPGNQGMKIQENRQGHLTMPHPNAVSESKLALTEEELFTLLDLCVSSLRRSHANLLCIVPILTDDPRRECSDDESVAILAQVHFGSSESIILFAFISLWYSLCSTRCSLRPMV